MANAKFTPFFVCLLAAATITACNRGPDAAGGNEHSAEAGGTAVMLKTVSNQYWATMQDGVKAEAAARKAPVTVQSASSEGAIDDQTTNLTNMIGNNFDCYAVAPITGTNLNQPLTQISGLDKPIINLDSPIDPQAAAAAKIKITSFISSNNSDAGKQAGEAMVKMLGGKGKVAVVAGLEGDANSNARTSNFAAAAQAGGLTVVQTVAADWDREKALDAATAILRANPDLGGFYAANDGMALGVVQAVQNEKRTSVKVIGTDGNEDALKSIKTGGLSATVAQYPYTTGLLGVDACLAAVGGATIPAAVDAPLALVDSANIDPALASYPKPFQPYANPFAALIK